MKYFKTINRKNLTHFSQWSRKLGDECIVSCCRFYQLWVWTNVIDCTKRTLKPTTNIYIYIINNFTLWNATEQYNFTWLQNVIKRDEVKFSSDWIIKMFYLGNKSQIYIRVLIYKYHVIFLFGGISVKRYTINLQDKCKFCMESRDTHAQSAKWVEMLWHEAI